MYEGVLKLHITVYYPLSVAVVKRHDQLLEEPPGLVLMQTSLFRTYSKESPPFAYSIAMPR